MSDTGMRESTCGTNGKLSLRRRRRLYRVTHGADSSGAPVAPGSPRLSPGTGASGAIWEQTLVRIGWRPSDLQDSMKEPTDGF